MESIANKTDGVDVLPDFEFNSHKNELQDLVTESGQTLALATTDQLRKAVSTFARSLTMTDSSGTPNTLTLSRPNSLTDIPAYYDGLTIFFETPNANTGATTVTINGLASKKVRTANDTDLLSGEILSGVTYMLVYDSALDSAAGGFELKVIYSNGGFKNLIVNGRKTIQQRGTTGGRRQIIDAEDILTTGKHTISFTGTATVRIYEATTLGATDATTTYTELTGGASTSGTVVTLTAGKYVKVEFSTTVFDNVQLEKGSIATTEENRLKDLELILCQGYYEINGDIVSANTTGTGTTSGNQGFRLYVSFKVEKRSIPAVQVLNSSTGTPNEIRDIATAAAVAATSSNISSKGFNVTNTAAPAAASRGHSFNFTANAEHFTDTYFEDRWF